MNRCSCINMTIIQQEMNVLTHREQLEKAAYTLKALANETRLCIVIQLSKHDEKTVTELVNDLNCEQSLLSHHLTDMRAKGILNCRKSGKNCYYSIKDERVIQLLECILKQC